MRTLLLLALASALAQGPPNRPMQGQRGGPQGSGQPPGQGRAGAAPQAQSAPIPAEKKGSVSGVVLNSRTLEPVRRAEVRLTRTRAADATGATAFFPGAAYSGFSDTAGHFEVAAVDPGTYQVSIRKTGFLVERGLAASAFTVKVGEAERVANLSYRLIPHAVITGKVVDEENEVVQDARVEALRYTYQRGRKRLTSSNDASTNDKGEYRIAGLAPGRYAVRVTYERGRGGPMGVASAVDDPSKPELSYVPVLFPGVLDPSQAAWIDLQSGQEMPNIDLALRKERSFRLSGSVIDGATGQPAQNFSVMLVARDGDQATGGRSGGPPRGNPGAFEILRVRPGSYWLVATVQGRGDRKQGQIPVEVGGGNVANLSVVAQPGFSITGSLAVEGVNDAVLAGARVTLIPALAVSGGSSAQTKDDGSFSLPNLSPGRYTLSAQVSGDSYYLASVLVNGQEFLAKEFDIPAPGTQLQVKFRAGGGALSGMVSKSGVLAEKGSVVAIPADPALRVDPFMRQAQLATGSRYDFKNLRPGDYLLFAVEELDSGEWYDPDWLRLRENRAVKVKVSASGVHNADLNILEPGR